MLNVEHQLVRDRAERAAGWRARSANAERVFFTVETRNRFRAARGTGPFTSPARYRAAIRISSITVLGISSNPSTRQNGSLRFSMAQELPALFPRETRA